VTMTTAMITWSFDRRVLLILVLASKIKNNNSFWRTTLRKLLLIWVYNCLVDWSDELFNNWKKMTILCGVGPGQVKNGAQLDTDDRIFISSIKA